MGATDSERFDVFFRGECLDGADVDAVRAALGRLFRADARTLETLFRGDLQRIKRGVDRQTAEKYRTAMEAAGARAIIRACGDAAPVEPSGTQAPDPAPASAKTAAPAGSFALDAVGSDLLRPEERPRHDAPAPATDHLDLAAVGETLGTETKPEPPVPAPDLEVAEVGSSLSSAAPRAAAAAPDTSDITLAAPEHDLSDCARPDSAAPPPAVDHLAMTQPGGTLINENERKKPQTMNPATEHLSLASDTDATDDKSTGQGGSGRFDRG